MKNLTKKLFAAAVIGASALMTTACAKKSDLLAQFPEMMKHCFGEDCKLTYVRSTKLSAYTTDDYRLEYKDHTGKTRVYSEDHFSIIPYDKETDADDYTEEEYYLGELELLADNQLSTLFSDELFEQILRSDMTAVAKGTTIRLGEDGSDGFIVISAGLLGSVCSDDPELQALGTELLSAEKGFELCKADLKSIVQDERLWCMINMRLKKSADAAAYQKEFEAFLTDFRKLGPVNYSAVLRQETLTDDGKLDTETVCREDCILGTVIDYDERRAAWTGEGSYSLTTDMAKSLLQKRKQS